jgi:glyoxylate reductase
MIPLVPVRNPPRPSFCIADLLLYQALARRCLPLRMKIQYHNRNRVFPEPDFPATYCQTLEELLQTSDFVSLHLPLNESTKGCFGTEQFGMMKHGSILINTARGGVVDEDALIRALDTGKVGFLKDKGLADVGTLIPCSCTLQGWMCSATSESLALPCSLR